MEYVWKYANKEALVVLESSMSSFSNDYDVDEVEGNETDSTISDYICIS